eukprot:ANDGO_03907.mRNA.1 Serine/threonine-protein kinase PEPKR2
MFRMTNESSLRKVEESLSPVAVRFSQAFDEFQQKAVRCTSFQKSICLLVLLIEKEKSFICDIRQRTSVPTPEKMIACLVSIQSLSAFCDMYGFLKGPDLFFSMLHVERRFKELACRLACVFPSIPKEYWNLMQSLVEDMRLANGKFHVSKGVIMNELALDISVLLKIGRTAADPRLKSLMITRDILSGALESDIGATLIKGVESNISLMSDVPYYVKSVALYTSFQIDESEVVIDDYYSRNFNLGHGGCGYVFRGWYRGKPVAVKQVRVYDDTIKRNYEMYHAFCHPNVGLVHGVVLPSDPSKGCPMLIMELLGKSWHQFVTQSALTPHADGATKHVEEQDPFEIDEMRISAFSDMAFGLAYLHLRTGQDMQSAVCHRDLKPQNVLADETVPNRWKLIDFELTSLGPLSVDDQRRRGCGTLGYMAPEALLTAGSPASDLWSMGVMMFVTLSNMTPLVPDTSNRKSVFAFFNSIKQSDLDQKIRMLVPASWQPVLSSCLQVKAEQRFSAARLLYYLIDLQFSVQNRLPERMVSSSCPRNEVVVISRTRASHPCSSSPSSDSPKIVLSAKRRKTWSSLDGDDGPPNLDDYVAHPEHFAK